MTKDEIIKAGYKIYERMEDIQKDFSNIFPQLIRFGNEEEMFKYFHDCLDLPLDTDYLTCQYKTAPCFARGTENFFENDEGSFFSSWQSVMIWDLKEMGDEKITWLDKVMGNPGDPFEYEALDPDEDEDEDEEDEEEPSFNYASFIFFNDNEYQLIILSSDEYTCKLAEKIKNDIRRMIG